MKTWLIGLAIPLGLVVLSSEAFAQVQFAWKFSVGQEFGVELTQRVETESQLGNMPLRVIVDTTLDQEWKVSEVDDDGVARIEQEFKRIMVKLELSQGGTIAYDSASTKKPSTEAKEIASSLAPLVGGKLQVRLAPNGEIRDVQLDAAMAEHLASLPGESSWKKLFSRDGLQQWMRQSLVVLPAEAVMRDSTWQRELDIAAPIGTIHQTRNFRYVGPELHEGVMLERIDVTSKVELGRGGPGVEPPTIKRQSQAGQIWFDTQAGRLVESRSSQQLRTEAKVRDTIVSVMINSELKTKLTLRNP